MALGALDQRSYGVYVRRNQDMADKSVGNIASLLESSAIDRRYPNLGQRKRGKFGNVRGWRRERLSTAHGFTLDALGVESASRGFKDEDRRPDFIILDDIDDKHDSPKASLKYIEIITSNILPAGSNDVAVLGVQNLVLANGFFSQLVGSADYLADRILDGPYPAIENFEYEQRQDPDTGQLRWFITGGQPTWAGQDLDVCQSQLTLWGLLSFRQEAQHEVDLLNGGMYDGLEFQRVAPDRVPPLIAVEVWVDPAITSTTNSNCQGIQADGIDAKKDLYRLRSWEGITSPEKAIEKAILWAIELKARAVGVETDQGGDTWQLTYNNTFKNMIEKGTIPKDAPKPQFKSAKASSIGGKIERQNMQRTDYDSGHIYHVVGTHQTLEKALVRFPLYEPFDLADASFYSWLHLRHRGSWTR